LLQKKKCKVFAFEPSVFNLELLARNINLNGETERIFIIPLPLSDKTQLNTMRMTSMELGGALSTFEKNIGWDGNYIEEVFRYQTLGSTIEDVMCNYGLQIPDYIKIDVDGIEHFILTGGIEVLNKVNEVLIEVNDGFKEQAEMCEKILLSAGLKLKEKRHSKEFDYIDSFGNGKVWNQIWVRN
jgi:FkbM family methyltransferase